MNPSINPVTYQSIQDTTEALLIEYDTTQTSYEKILQEWKALASPYPSTRQYRTALWYLNEQQERIAREFVSTNMPQGKYVDVEPATRFWKAEEYHQNFLQKQTGARAPVF